MKLVIEQVTGKTSFGIGEYARQLNRHVNETGVYTGLIKTYTQRLTRGSTAIFHFSNATRSVLVPLIRRRGGQNIVLVHDVFPRSELVMRLYPVFMRMISKKADIVLVHSNTARDLLLGAYPFFRKNRVVVIPHGTFIRETGAGEKEKMRAKHGFGRDDKILFMLGGISKKRGQARFLSAFDKTSAKNLKLIVSGHVTDESALHITRKNKSIFYYGFADNAMVDEFYTLCDAVAVYREHSVGESSSSIAYGLGFGKPLLASATDSFTEMIGNSGILFPNDETAITALLEEFAAGKTDLSILERHAREKRETYRWDNYLRKVVSLNAN